MQALGLINAIPDAGEDDAMTGIHRCSKFEDIKAQLKAGSDSASELLRGASGLVLWGVLSSFRDDAGRAGQNRLAILSNGMNDHAFPGGILTHRRRDLSP